MTNDGMMNELVLLLQAAQNTASPFVAVVNTPLAMWLLAHTPALPQPVMVEVLFVHEGELFVFDDFAKLSRFCVEHGSLNQSDPPLEMHQPRCSLRRRVGPHQHPLSCLCAAWLSSCASLRDMCLLSAEYRMVRLPTDLLETVEGQPLLQLLQSLGWQLHGSSELRRVRARQYTWAAPRFMGGYEACNSLPNLVSAPGWDRHEGYCLLSVPPPPAAAPAGVAEAAAAPGPSSQAAAAGVDGSQQQHEHCAAAGGAEGADGQGQEQEQEEQEYGEQSSDSGEDMDLGSS